ncbi:MAG TPA: hypothetical protein VK969_05150 [Acidimicrobiia bacterium]|nr:hypothetical protein [Acidimicrobiia bacterium]
MADHSDEADIDHSARMGKAVAKGVIIGFPVALLGLTVAVWLITDLDIVDSFATALLPGILLGGFAGGFVGVAGTMD